MGIQGFNRWILSTFPEIVRAQGPKMFEVYDHGKPFEPTAIHSHHLRDVCMHANSLHNHSNA